MSHHHKNRHAKITFLGATRTVTGSSTLIEVDGYKLLVDCGMFQGPKDIRRRNWDIFDKELASKIDGVVLTHAHVDHSGMIPKLYSLGYRGKVYSSEGTFELCKILLPDSAYLQEEDARRSKVKNGHSFRGPLYTTKDAQESLGLFEVIERHQWYELAPGLSLRMFRAGHILGSCILQISISLENEVKILTFSGDLGNNRQRMIKGPEEIFESDILVLESTYGDRIQPKTSPEKQLKKHVDYIVRSGGALVIPAFAVGRTQEILYMLKTLEEEGEIPKLPVFVDSPMAIEATELYLMGGEDIKLQVEEGQLTPPLSPSHFHGVRKLEDSIRLTTRTGPVIIISAAGMLTGGRILYHLKTRLPDPNSVVLFVGFQAEDTKGRLLQHGLKNIRIHKENIPVKARVETIEALSAHADSDELVEWVKQFQKLPKTVYLNHGEYTSQKALAYRLQHELGLQCEIPEGGQSFPID